MASSSEPSSSFPAPTTKRKQAEVEDSDNHNSQEASSADEKDLDVLQHSPPTDDDVLSHAERRRQKKKLKREQLTAASPRKKRKLDDSAGDSSTSNVHADSEAKSNAGLGVKIKFQNPTKARTKADGASDDPSRQKRQNSVWVGNLSFRTTEDALRGFFDGVGTITRVNMPMRRGNQTQGENMGFAYVDFETPEAKTIAITLSEGQLDGRNLLIKDGDDFAGRPAKSKSEPSEGGGGEEGEKLVKVATSCGKGLPKSSQRILRTQKQPPAPTLFLGNLGFETTEESIRELFEAHRYKRHQDKGKEVDAEAGEGKDDAQKPKDVWIRKIRMGTFEDSGACKGFAFVDFTSIEYATGALINPLNHRLNGRDLVVEYASPDAVRRGGGPRNVKGDHSQKSTAKAPHWQKETANTPYTKQRRPRYTEQTDKASGADGAETLAGKTTATRRSGRPERAGHDGQHTRRAKPGAALAQAHRQSAAILPSQNQKIVF